jgi:hypothetical protein
MSEQHPAEVALNAVCILKDLAFARSRKEFWYERLSYAQAMRENWMKEIERLEAKNQGKPFEPKPYASLY